MKNLTSRLLLLLATGIFCLGCGTPVQSQRIDAEKVKTLQNTLKAASERSEPVTIEATYGEALNLVQALKPEVIEPTPDNNLRFKYAGKWFVLKEDSPGNDSSHILYETEAAKPVKTAKEVKVVVFDPKAKKK